MAEISIVIPVYNAACFLREALASLQAQTFTDWECICVNDGSTDDSATIIREMMAVDARFSLFEQANAGPGAARNYGVAQSNAPYIFFMDADDCLYPNALETLYRVAIQDSVEVVWGRITHFIDSLSEVSTTGEARIIEGDTLQKWVSEKFSNPSYSDVFYGIPVEVWGKLFKRDLIKRNPQPEDLRVGEDSVFNAILFQQVRRVGVVDALIYGYRQVASSLYHQRSEAWVAGYTKACCRILDLYVDNPSFCRNYLNQPLRTGFIRMVFTDGVVAKQKALYPAIQQMCNAFLTHPASHCINSKLKWWLWLGAHQWRGLLRWSYKRSTLYKKSLNW